MFIGIQDVDEVVRYAFPLVVRWLCRRDVHPAIEKAGIGIYDLAVQGQGEFDSDGCLAGSGCSNDSDKVGF